MPKYLVNHVLLAPFSPESGERKTFSPGDIVTASDLKSAGFDKGAFDRLLVGKEGGFAPALVVVKGTEDYADVPTVRDAAEPLTGGALDTAPKPETSEPSDMAQVKSK